MYRRTGVFDFERDKALVMLTLTVGLGLPTDNQ